jgi:tRNA pseudouridine13 synthase
MGMEVYSTGTAGLGGAIRRAVEDFVVEETLVDGSVATVQKNQAKPALGASMKKRQFLLCVLVKRNWDTFIAVKNVARSLGISQESIQFAGIKDAKAVTAQYVTIEGVSMEEAAAVHVKDVELRPVGFFRDCLCSFYLLGNNFKIALREVNKPKTALERGITSAVAEIMAAGGIPNFYGHQRFGTTRSITHYVGKALVQGDLEKAAMLFLANPGAYEHPDSRRVRAELETSKDFKLALRDFPMQLRFERIMLAYLVENPNDFSGAFRRLPPKLQMLFVQAWQSYLFNRFLSARVKSGFSLCKAEVGDYLVNLERSGLPVIKTGRIVQSSNITEMNASIQAGRMRVALPIFGAKQKLSEGEMGVIERQVLEEECVKAEEFRVPLLSEICAKGELRSAVCPVKNFAAGAVTIDFDGKAQIPLEFMLLRGAYATVFLREIMKPENPVVVGF